MNDISKSRIGNFVPGKVENGGYVSYQRRGPLNEGGRNILGVVGTIEDRQMIESLTIPINNSIVDVWNGPIYPSVVVYVNSPCLHLNDGAKHQSQNREYHDPEKKRINFMVRSNKWIIGFLTIF